MDVFAEYLAGIVDPQHRERIEEILQWVMARFPNLVPRIAWKQPMFTHYGTFIIAFSVAKHHMSVAPERVAINRFTEEIADAGYEHSKELIRIPWSASVNYLLLEKIIEFNVLDKAGYRTFWRK
jgi:uncharacterized protein YdhG (YjbR/CyaY superfamily)